jgi:hypothetical protein
MARVISIHEYDLKPGADVAAFSIDEYRQSTRAAFFRHVWSSAVRPREGRGGRSILPFGLATYHTGQNRDGELGSPYR